MLTPTTLFEQVKKAVGTAWTLAEDEALDPDSTDPDNQDREVEYAYSRLRPLLRELQLDEELTELDAAWGPGGALGLQRKLADRPNGAWAYCSVLDAMAQILTRVELRLSDESGEAAAAVSATTDTTPEAVRLPLPVSGPTIFTVHARNFFGLRELEFSPVGVSLLVGANGAGKTTVLLLLKLLRTALERGMAEAIRVVLGGAHGLKHRDAREEEPVEFGVRLDDLRWVIQLDSSGPGGNQQPVESLHDGAREVFRRDALGTFVGGEAQLRSDGRLLLRTVFDSSLDDPAVNRMVACLGSICVFHDPDLHALRSGSNTAHLTRLSSRGDNAITMLRAWHQHRPDRDRHAFVLAGLAAAFPGLIEDLDFVEAGNTLAARVYRPGHEAPEPLRSEANGVIAMLVLLCDLAAVDDGGVVAIDEPETALHPFALRAFARFADRAARKRQLRVILATHSTVLLDAYDAHPERVHVLDPQTRPGPTPLTELKNPAWLRQFRLGELYADGELGSNDDLGSKG